MKSVLPSYRELCDKESDVNAAEAAHKLLQANVDKLKKDFTQVDGKVEEIRSKQKDIRDANHNKLQSVLDEITRKKEEVAAGTEPLLAAQEDQTLLRLEQEAEEAFNQSASEQFRSQKELQQNHFLLIFNRAVSRSSFGAFLKDGLKHLAYKRYHMGVAPGLMAEDAVTVIPFGSGTAQFKQELGGWDEAIERFVESDDEPSLGCWTGCHEALKLALTAIESHRSKARTGHNTHIMFFTSEKFAEDKPHSECALNFASLMYQTASRSMHDAEKNGCSSVSFILGSDVHSEDLSKLPHALNGFRPPAKHARIEVCLPKPADMVHTFNSVSQWVHTFPESANRFRLVSSVMENLREIVKKKTLFNAERSKRKLDLAQKQLERLDRQGELKKKQIDEVAKNILEFYDAELKELQGLSQSTSAAVRDGEVRLAEMKADIDFKKKELEILRKTQQEQEKTLALDNVENPNKGIPFVVNRYEQARMRLFIKNFAFDEKAFHEAAMTALDVWDRASSCLKWRHNVFKINLRELVQHLENLNAQTNVTFSLDVIKNKVMWSYRKAAIVNNVDPAFEMQNWKEVVRFHVGTAQATATESGEFGLSSRELDQAVAVFAKHMPLVTLLNKDVLDKRAYLLKNLQSETQFKAERRTLETAEKALRRAMKVLKEIKNKLEDHFSGEPELCPEELTRTQADEQTAIEDVRIATEAVDVAKHELDDAVTEKYGFVLDMVVVVQQGVAGVAQGVHLAAGADEHICALRDLAMVFQDHGVGKVEHLMLKD
jgi:hypothetical protein